MNIYERLIRWLARRYISEAYDEGREDATERLQDDIRGAWEAGVERGWHEGLAEAGGQRVRY